jgi:hypothetical protein
MAARRALEGQRVLAKLIAQFVDMKFAGHATDCYEAARASPSSTGTEGTLYKQGSSPLAESRCQTESRRAGEIETRSKITDRAPLIHRGEPLRLPNRLGDEAAEPLRGVCYFGLWLVRFKRWSFETLPIFNT